VTCFRARFAGLTACLLLVVSVASAHESRPAYLEIKETSPGQFSVLWRTPVLAGMRLPIVIKLPDDVKNLREPDVQELSDSFVDGFASFGGCDSLNRIARSIRAQEAVGFHGIMNNVSDRSPASSPRCEQSGDIRFCLRIVAFAPTGIEKCLLHINDDQRGGLGKLHHCSVGFEDARSDARKFHSMCRAHRWAGHKGCLQHLKRPADPNYRPAAKSP